jgi:hypothetical protein
MDVHVKCPRNPLHSFHTPDSPLFAELATSGDSFLHGWMNRVLTGGRATIAMRWEGGYQWNVADPPRAADDLTEINWEEITPYVMRSYCPTS